MKHKHTKPQPSWLLQGLMIRAGLYDPLPFVFKKHSVEVDGYSLHVDRINYEQLTSARPAGKSWVQRAWAKAKAAFVYDPDRT